MVVTVLKEESKWIRTTILNDQRVYFLNFYYQQWIGLLKIRWFKSSTGTISSNHSLFFTSLSFSFFIIFWNRWLCGRGNRLNIVYIYDVLCLGWILRRLFNVSLLLCLWTKAPTRFFFKYEFSFSHSLRLIKFIWTFCVSNTLMWFFRPYSRLNWENFCLAVFLIECPVVTIQLSFEKRTIHR